MENPLSLSPPGGAGASGAGESRHLPEQDLRGPGAPSPRPRAPPRAPRAPHLQQGGPRAHGPGRGAGPRARGGRAALPPRPPAAGPQPSARRRGAAAGRRTGTRCPQASTLGAWKAAPGKKRRRRGAGGCGLGSLCGLHLQPAGQRLARAEPLSPPPPRGAPRPPSPSFLSPTRFSLPISLPRPADLEPGIGRVLARPRLLGEGFRATEAALQPHALEPPAPPKQTCPKKKRSWLGRGLGKDGLASSCPFIQHSGVNRKPICLTLKQKEEEPAPGGTRRDGTADSY